MRLSDFIIDMGRPVAVYTGLRKLTKSLTATVLLCQMIYWDGKTRDENGWFYKSAEELTEETSLTYAEQKAARSILRDELGIVEEQHRRSEHKLYFKVNKDILNEKWELIREKPLEVEKSIFDDVPEEKEVETPKKKKDLVDGVMELYQMPGAKKSLIKIAIESKIAVRLKINPSGKRWEEFINYAADRQIKDKQTIDVFIDWILQNGFNPMYTTPEKMRTVWPSAFYKEPLDDNDGFVVQLQEVEVEKEYAPMPTGFGRRNT